MAPPKALTSQHKPPTPPPSQVLSKVSIPITSMPPPPLPAEERRRSTRQRRPPSRPNSDPSTSSASQTSSQRERERKRKRGDSRSGSSGSYAKSFPESVKNRIRNASSGDKCWLCGDVGRDIAHVIASSESKVSAPDFIMTSRDSCSLLTRSPGA